MSFISFPCNCTHTLSASAVASNCIAVVDRYISVFILAPLSHPRLSLAPPGEKEEPTAIFGHVNKQRKYTCHGALRQKNRIFSFSTCLSNGYFFPLNTRPNMAVSSLSRPAGRERAGGESGAKKRKNRSLTFNPSNGRTTMCPHGLPCRCQPRGCHRGFARNDLNRHLDHLPRDIVPEGAHV